MMLKCSTVAPATVRTGLTASIDLKQWAGQIKRNLETPVQTSEPTIGERVKEALAQRRLGSFSRIQASVSASEGESFGQQIKKAVEKHPHSQESVRKRQEKERDRWRRAAEKTKPRRHTKGE